MADPTFGSFVYTSNAPDGVVCGRIGQFILLSLLSDEYVVRWHDIGDVTTWSTPNTDAARAAQAGQETLSSEYGKVTAITGNDFFGFVFQQTAITKFTYVGGDVVFRIVPFETSRGCIDYNRIARVDDTIFFQSEIGYHALNGDDVLDIGLGVVDDSHEPFSLLANGQYNIVANPRLNVISFEDNNVCYNYKTNQWTRTPAFAGRVYFPPRDEVSIAGQIVYSGTDVDIQTSEGGIAQSAKLVTADGNLNQGGRAVINGVRPLVDGGVWSVRVGTRNNLSDGVSWSASTTVNTRAGFANMRKEGRYARAEYTNSNGFTTAIGADIEFSPQGRL
jgi:hypothetical protein